MKKFLKKHRLLIQLALMLGCVVFALVTSSCTGPWA